MEWQPIETAPKDGTHVLLAEVYHPDLACPMFRGSYIAGEDEDDSYWLSYCGQSVTEKPDPTHWMPLPAPPCLN